MLVRRQVVILAGGLGTRLRPITEEIPKPLVEVAGQPFLYWQLMDLKSQGYTKIVLLVSYLGEKIQNYFGDGRQLGLEISYSIESEPLGTGGAIKYAANTLDDEFILLNGDSFLKMNLSKFESLFDSENMDALIVAYDNNIVTPVTPNLRLDSKNLGSQDSKSKDQLDSNLSKLKNQFDSKFDSKLSKIISYSKSGGVGYDFVDAGVYILKKQMFIDMNESSFLLEAVLQDKIKKDRVFGLCSDERFYDIGTTERLQQFEEKINDYF